MATTNIPSAADKPGASCPPSSSLPPTAHAAGGGWNLSVLVLGTLACLAAFALYAYPTSRPLLMVDDFQILLRSWTWRLTWENLWQPSNEHTMPLGRLSTWALVQIAGKPTAVPLAAALQGPLATRTKAALLAGCDIALHCNGELDEMKQVAREAKTLTGPALLRAQAALAQLHAPAEIDIERAEARLSEMTGALA